MKVFEFTGQKGELINQVDKSQLINTNVVFKQMENVVK